MKLFIRGEIAVMLERIVEGKLDRVYGLDIE